MSASACPILPGIGTIYAKWKYPLGQHLGNSIEIYLTYFLPDLTSFYIASETPGTGIIINYDMKALFRLLSCSLGLFLVLPKIFTRGSCCSEILSSDIFSPTSFYLGNTLPKNNYTI